MILFSYSEFWLSLSFLIVVGMVVLPPVRQHIRSYLNQGRQKIENDIHESDRVYREALAGYKMAQKELRSKLVDKDLSDKIKQIHQAFDDKNKMQTTLKKQNIQIQQNLILMQMKTHLRADLLEGIQEGISKSCPSKKNTSKEIQHFLKVLHENKEQLRFSLKH